MYSIGMFYSLAQLFEMMSGEGEEVSVCFCGTDSHGQGDLFNGDVSKEGRYFHFEEADITIAAGMHSASGIDPSALPYNAGRLYELSANAFDTIVHAWMSELPVAAEIIRFGRKILATTGRQAAYLVATDRSDADVQTVETAAFKVWREFDRLRGLLRFTPDEDGVYAACCEPDHFILPAFGPHFRERFGQTPWAIIDAKRRICLCGEQGQAPVLFDVGKSAEIAGRQPGGEWEDLWRHYHKTINNESRNNPDLQKQFMPKRYWKYLTEL